MTAHLPLATTASLIADPARAAMLLALLDGRALTAGELARSAGVSAQSASMHLAQLRHGGFVEVAPQGRHRYYRIATAEIAHAVEALGVISSPRRMKPIGESEEIRFARTCYNHVAGKLGVTLASGFEDHKLITPLNAREYTVTKKGEVFFERWNIDVAALRRANRILARRCLDWTERRYHVAGSLGAAIYRRMLDLGWVECSGTSRVLYVTAPGKDGLATILADSQDQNASGAAEPFAGSFRASSTHGANTGTSRV